MVDFVVVLSDLLLLHTQRSQVRWFRQLVRIHPGHRLRENVHVFLGRDPRKTQDTLKRLALGWPGTALESFQKS